MRKNRLNWFWNFQFSGWLRRFWAIFEKFHFWKKNSKCFESFWEIFWKKLNFEKFTSVSTHFVWGKNVWMIKIDVWKSFFPRLKIIFPLIREKWFSDVGKTIFRRGKNDFQTWEKWFSDVMLFSSRRCPFSYRRHTFSLWNCSK